MKLQFAVINMGAMEGLFAGQDCTELGVANRLLLAPVGKYIPDWAILKHDGQALYLVCETKGTRYFLKLRSSEADKVRCEGKHFETLWVPFEVVVSADEV